MGKMAVADAWRVHAFWECSIAKAVLNEIDHAASTREAMERHHLWLSSPPPTHHPINPSIWLVVTLAAFTAMEHGRKAMYAMQKETAPNHQTRRRPQIHTPPISVRAANAAVGRFWCLLQDYADIGGPITPPPPLHHPFLTMKDNHLSLHLPTPDRLPVDLDLAVPPPSNTTSPRKGPSAAEYVE